MTDSLIRRARVETSKKACARGETSKTIRGFCKQYGIGGPAPGSPIEISMPVLMMVKHGDVAALMLVRQAIAVILG